MSACYRSKHPDVLAVWEDSQRRYRETHEAISRFKKKYVGAKGEAMVYNGSDYRLAAVRTASASYNDPPKGGEELWRYDHKAGGWVPRRKTKEGKALAKEFDACRSGRLGEVPGLPMYVQVKVGMFNMQGAALFGDGEYVWACWPSVDHEDVVNSSWGDLDESMWEQVKRSEYEAAKEARDEKERVA